jgi:hypothetical protein
LQHHRPRQQHLHLCGQQLRPAPAAPGSTTPLAARSFAGGLTGLLAA